MLIELQMLLVQLHLLPLQAFEPVVEITANMGIVTVAILAPQLLPLTA